MATCWLIRIAACRINSTWNKKRTWAFIHEYRNLDRKSEYVLSHLCVTDMHDLIYMTLSSYSSLVYSTSTIHWHSEFGSDKFQSMGVILRLRQWTAKINPIYIYGGHYGLLHVTCCHVGLVSAMNPPMRKWNKVRQTLRLSLRFLEHRC